MGHVNDVTKDYRERFVLFSMTRAARKPAVWNVPDHEYVQQEPLPDLDHGIIWAHSLGASPHDIFGEMLAYIDIRIEKIRIEKREREAAALRTQITTRGGRA